MAGEDLSECETFNRVRLSEPQVMYRASSPPELGWCEDEDIREPSSPASRATVVVQGIDGEDGLVHRIQSAKIALNVFQSGECQLEEVMISGVKVRVDREM